jgi:hypothetical protein
MIKNTTVASTQKIIARHLISYSLTNTHGSFEQNELDLEINHTTVKLMIP